MIEDALTTALPVLRALGEATRVRIIGVFLDRGGSATVGEVQSELGLPQSTVSRHLRILLDARLLTVSPTGSTASTSPPTPSTLSTPSPPGVRECQAAPHP